MAITHTHNGTSSHTLSHALHAAAHSVFLHAVGFAHAAMALAQRPKIMVQNHNAAKQAKMASDQKVAEIQKRQRAEMRLGAILSVLPEPEKKKKPPRTVEQQKAFRDSRNARKLARARLVTAQMAASNSNPSISPR